MYTIALFVAISSCVDPVAFKIPTVEFQLVVDGSITNKPGPYRVYLSRVSALRNDLDARDGIAKAQMTIHSDAGESEQLKEISRGIYETSTIQGVIGRSYWLTIRTDQGVEYESDPELMNPVGELNSVSWKFQQDNVLSNGIEIASDRFDILVSATGANNRENYYRWRTTGTFAIRTLPHLMTAVLEGGVVVPAPAPCSGYVVMAGGVLQQTSPCTCCDCWVTVNDRLPYVYDDSFTQGGSFRNVNIGAVPINRRTFYEKYNLHVEQISLNKKAYDFFRLIKAQKEGASSLFLPASGKLKSNFHRVDAEEEVFGYFWAGAVNTKMIFINKSEVPYRVPPIDSIKMECYRVLGAVATKPDFWN